MDPSPGKKPGLKPATGCLVAIYLYSLLFGYVALSFMSQHHDGGVVSIFTSVWGVIWLLAFFIVPVNIYIFHRVYDQLRALDFICLCLPFVGWLLFGIALLFAPWVPMMLTGGYFLVFPISKRFPGVSRSVISFLLVGIILTVLVLIIHFFASSK